MNNNLIDLFIRIRNRYYNEDNLHYIDYIHQYSKAHLHHRIVCIYESHVLLVLLLLFFFLPHHRHDF